MPLIAERLNPAGDFGFSNHIVYIVEFMEPLNQYRCWNSICDAPRYELRHLTSVVVRKATSRINAFFVRH